MIARVPENTPGDVFITGNLPELGNWDPGKVALSAGAEGRREFTAEVPCGTRVEFKLTQGSWDTEMLQYGGKVPGNFTVDVEGNTLVFVEVPFFRSAASAFEALESSTGPGHYTIFRDMESGSLERRRHVVVWTPPEYEDSTRRFPVLYMHDGQNLFDESMAFGGEEWGVDETITRLTSEGRIRPCIVVGVFNTADRRSEYSAAGKGEDYARFLISELKPMVDSKFRTLDGPENTGVMGSSMGGQISLYLGWKHPGVFGRAGCLSTYLEDGYKALGVLEKLPPPPATSRFWVDHGSAERGGSYDYAPGQERLAAMFRKLGFKDGREFICHVEPDAEHNEAFWRARLEKPLLYLFPAEEPKP